MIFSPRKKLPAYQFESFQKFAPDFQHSVFTRNGGLSEGAYSSLNIRFSIGDSIVSVFKNRKLICDAFDVSENKLVSANQTHSDHVQLVDNSFDPIIKEKDGFDDFDDTDAFVCGVKNIACMIQVADCQAQILYDPEHHVFGVVHAGWKGLAQDITGTTLRKMQDAFGSNPEKIMVGIAPSLGPCCAYFSDPQKELPLNFQSFIDDKNRVDLWAFSCEQLKSHSIKEKNIEITKLCTQCQGEDFFSYRRDKGITGRFAIVAMLQ